MRLPASHWGNGSFALKGDISCGTISCMKWPLASLRHIGDVVYVPMYLAIDTALTADPDTNLMGTFTSTEANAEPLCVRNTVYLPATFAGIFLDQDLTSVEA